MEWLLRWLLWLIFFMRNGVMLLTLGALVVGIVLF